MVRVPTEILTLGSWSPAVHGPGPADRDSPPSSIGVCGPIPAK